MTRGNSDAKLTRLIIHLQGANRLDNYKRESYRVSNRRKLMAWSLAVKAKLPYWNLKILYEVNLISKTSRYRLISWKVPNLCCKVTSVNSNAQHNVSQAVVNFSILKMLAHAIPTWQITNCLRRYSNHRNKRWFSYNLLRYLGNVSRRIKTGCAKVA
jgi:hypothetical protein